MAAAHLQLACLCRGSHWSSRLWPGASALGRSVWHPCRQTQKNWALAGHPILPLRADPPPRGGSALKGNTYQKHLSRGVSGAFGCLSCRWTTLRRWHVDDWEICLAGTSHVWNGARRKLICSEQAVGSVSQDWAHLSNCLSPFTVLTCVLPWTTFCRGANSEELPTWHLNSGADTSHFTEGYQALWESPTASDWIQSSYCLHYGRADSWELGFACSAEYRIAKGPDRMQHQSRSTCGKCTQGERH